MKYFKVMIDYKNFIPIDETELEKAITAFSTGKPVIFNNGASEKVQAILPDYHRAMGWNYGYDLKGEDWGAIESSKECKDTRVFLERTKNAISSRIRELSGPQMSLGT